MGTVIYLKKEYKVQAEPIDPIKHAVQKAYDSECLFNDIFVSDDPFVIEKENLIQQAFYRYSLDGLDEEVKEGSKENAFTDCFVTESLQGKARLKSNLYSHGGLKFLTEEEIQLFTDIEEAVNDLLTDGGTR